MKKCNEKGQMQYGAMLKVIGWVIIIAITIWILYLVFFKDADPKLKQIQTCGIGERVGSCKASCGADEQDATQIAQNTGLTINNPCTDPINKTCCMNIATS
jgi:hypothetical protein